MFIFWGMDFYSVIIVDDLLRYWFLKEKPHYSIIYIECQLINFSWHQLKQRGEVNV